MELEKIITPLLGASCVVSFTEDSIIVSNTFAQMMVDVSHPEFAGLSFKGDDFVHALKRFPLESFVRSEDEIVCKKGRTTLTLCPIQGKVPVLDIPSTVLTLPSNFNDGLSKCYIAGNRSPYSGVYVSDTFMLYTDGKKIIRHTLVSPMDTFWISDSNSKLFASYSFEQYALTPKHFIGICPEYTLYIHRLRDESYPVSKLLTFFDDADIVHTFPVGTSNAIKEASIMGLEDGNCKLFLSGTEKSLIVSGGKRTGKYTLELQWEGFYFTFVGLYKHLASIADGDSFTVVQDKLCIMQGFTTHMIMGMREG